MREVIASQRSTMSKAERSRPPARSRWESLHLLRAVAALLVLVHHVPQFLESRALFAVWTFEAGAAGVDVFFVISGFVMYCATAPKSESWSGFLRKRAIRVLPMYWLVTIALTAAVWCVPSAFARFRVSPELLIKSLLFIPSYDAHGAIRPVLAVGWTLHFELLFYALVAAALPSSQRRASLVAAAALLGLSALATLAALPQPHSAWLLLSPISWEFALGVGLAHALHATSILQLSRALRAGLSAAALALGVSAIALYEPRGLGLERVATWGAGAFGIVAALALLEPELARMPRLQRCYRGMGDASYALYLIHGSVFPVVWKLLPPPLQASATVAWAVLLILPPLAAWQVHVWVEARLTRALSSSGRASARSAPARAGLERYGE
jgi:exopolysaccharide production protein ExoZ